MRASKKGRTGVPQNLPLPLNISLEICYFPGKYLSVFFFFWGGGGDFPRKSTPGGGGGGGGVRFTALYRDS